MAAALSLYVPGDSPVHRLHPLTKLSLAFFVLVAGLTLPGPWLNYLPLVLVLIPLALLSGTVKHLIKAALRVAFPFALSVFLIQGFLWPRGTPLINLGWLALKLEGLIFAVTSTGRILTVLSSFLWLAFTTRPDMLMLALAQRGLPSGISYMIVATLQIVPRFQARAAAILDAQRSRGLETGGNLAQRARAVLPLVVPLILSSLVDVEERALAIEARGFNRPGPKTSLLEITQASWEPPVRVVLLFTAAATIVLRLWFF